METKPTLLFVYDLDTEDIWRDGLWAALEILKQDFNIIKANLAGEDQGKLSADFILGWGGFNSSVDRRLQSLGTNIPMGLCVGGASFPPDGMEKYKVLFYETEVYKGLIPGHSNMIHAFGVNTDIYGPNPNAQKLFDYLDVGSFALWKRHEKMKDKTGVRLVIGDFQKKNQGESIDVAFNLVLAGIGVMDSVAPEVLVKFYQAARKVYIPCSIYGGGERAVLEARACGVPVETEEDNLKLKELLTSPIWDHTYYAEQLKKGIMGVLEKEKEGENG